MALLVDEENGNLPSGYADEKDKDGDSSEDTSEDDDTVSLEYIDEYVEDDGYFTPPDALLVIMLILIVLVAAGLGIIVHFARENLKDDDPATTKAPIKPPVMAPTEAPTAATLPSVLDSEIFVCPICPDNQVMTNLDTAVPVPTQPSDRTCQDYLNIAEAGNITEAQCPLLAPLLQAPCGCMGDGDDSGINATNTTTGDPVFVCQVCAEGSVRNTEALVDVGSLGIGGVGVSCGQLQVQSVSEALCPALQALTVEPCDCLRTTTTILSLLESVVGSSIQTPSSAQYQAYQWLLQEDPRFPGGVSSQEPRSTTRRRELQTPIEPIVGGAPNETAWFICPICPGDGANGGNNINKAGIVENLPTTILGLDDPSSCDALFQVALAGGIPQEDCPAVQELTQEPCGCTGGVVTPPMALPDVKSGCNICGDGGVVTNDEGIIVIPGSPDTPPTCAQAAQNTSNLDLLSDLECAALQRISNYPCECLHESVLLPGNEGVDPEAFVCHPCGVGFQLNLTESINSSTPPVDIPGLGNRTCLDISNQVSQIITTELQCTMLQPLVKTGCTCQQEDAIVFPPMGAENTINVTTQAFSFTDISDEELIQRYLVVLFYFQTTNNLQDSWTNTCAAPAPGSDPAETSCEYRVPGRFPDGSIDSAQESAIQLASKWLSADWECMWAGITCSVAPEQVEAIWLVDFGLIGNLATDILSLPKLDWLDLSHNQLAGSLPSAYLEKMSTLEVNHNNLSGNTLGLEESWINSNIRFLNVAANQLTGALPTTISKNKPLERLWAYENLLNATIPPSLLNDAESNIRVLHLSGNDLTGSIPYIGRTAPAIGSTLELLDLSLNKLTGTLGMNVESLTSLNLASNLLEGEIPMTLGQSFLLEELHLNNNKFEGNITEDLWGLAALTSLNMGQNFFSGTIPSTIGRLNKLQAVAFESNSLRGNFPSEIGLLTNLAMLNLASNGFGGTLASTFGNLTSLKELIINDNFFGGELPTELLQLTGLKVLHLNKNGFVGEVPFVTCTDFGFESMRADCAEVTCDCCTDCCTDDGVCEVASSLVI